MSHEIERILRAAGRGPWFIAPQKAEEIVALLSLRMAAGPRAEPAFPDRRPLAMAETRQAAGRTVQVLRMHGTIMPRGNMMSDMSGAVSLDRFQAAFRQTAADTTVAAIVLDIDSPGGDVQQVQETVAMIRAARRADRPIVAVANGWCASAAYWIACAADEIVATPSGEVGGIGVYTVHRDMSAAMEAEGIKVTYLAAGPRKVEGNPFEPLDDAGRAAALAAVGEVYDLFVRDVAKGRGVPTAVVRADPETSERHFGGGRAYLAAHALSLGMIDRIATLDETVQRLARGQRGSRSAAFERERLSLI